MDLYTTEWRGSDKREKKLAREANTQPRRMTKAFHLSPLGVSTVQTSQTAVVWLHWWMQPVQAKCLLSIYSSANIRSVLHFPSRLLLQSGAVKLVLWRHRMLVNQVHPVMSENQFHCTRLYTAAFWWNERRKQGSNLQRQCRATTINTMGSLPGKFWSEGKGPWRNWQSSWLGTGLIPLFSFQSAKNLKKKKRTLSLSLSLPAASCSLQLKEDLFILGKKSRKLLFSRWVNEWT